MLINSINSFIREHGIEFHMEEIDGHNVIFTDRGTPIFPICIYGDSPEMAAALSDDARQVIDKICSRTGSYPLIITQDRWHYQEDMMHRRLLAHLQIYVQIYARNCEVRKIDKATAGKFLAANHSYGDATCRYRYGLFLKRYTGHTCDAVQDRPQPGDLVAVATFSNARKWIKGEKAIRSYEWTRFASLPGVRLSGGMGRLLKAFIDDVKPDDIMTYADLEWSRGDVYEALGFVFEGTKEPVMFSVDCKSWQRSAHIGQNVTSDDPCRSEAPPSRGWHVISCHRSAPNRCFRQRFIQNFGSNKYRLKLTDYQ